MKNEPWLEYPVADLLAQCGRKLALDIGANHGTWSIVLKPLFEKVIAVEPDDRCPQIPNVDFYRCVVGETSGFATLWLSDQPEQNHLDDFHPLHRTGGRPVRVPVVTLDELCAGQRPDFIKLDVEGAEDLILAAVSDPQHYAQASFLVESHHREDELTRIFDEWRRPFRKIPHPHGSADHCWMAVPALSPKP